MSLHRKVVLVDSSRRKAVAVGQLCGKIIDSIENLFRSHRVIFVLASCFSLLDL